MLYEVITHFVGPGEGRSCKEEKKDYQNQASRRPDMGTRQHAFLPSTPRAIGLPCTQGTSPLFLVDGFRGERPRGRGGYDGRIGGIGGDMVVGSGHPVKQVIGTVSLDDHAEFADHSYNFV